MALLGAEETLLSIAYHPQRQEFAIAAIGGGAYVHRWQGDLEEPVLGQASPTANVICTPARWCHETDALVVHLQQTGLGMPLQLLPRGPEGESCCEGLLDVLFGRADVYLAPPARFTADEPPLPPPVIAAFDLLFREAEGCLSDVYGQSHDVLAIESEAIYSEESATPQRGVLVCADSMHPYFVRATAVAFPPFKSELQRLTDKLLINGKYDGPPLRLVDGSGADDGVT